MSKIMKKLAGVQTRVQNKLELEVKSYDGLKNHVSKTLADGRAEAQEAVDRVKAQTYWNVGRLIDSHVLQSQKRGDYGKKVIQRLAKDLKTNQTLLYYSLQFARSYETLPASNKITWSHYRALLPIKDEQKRQDFEEKVEEWGWSSRQLEKSIAEQKKKSSKAVQRGSSLKFIQGNLYHYPVVEESKGRGLMLELGCSNFYKPEDFPKKFYPGDLVRVIKEADGRYKWIKPAVVKKTDANFYRADYLSCSPDCKIRLSIDLGFGLFTTQQVRLRGVAESVNLRKKLTSCLKKSAQSSLALRVRLHETVNGLPYADVFFENNCLNESL